MKKRSRFVVYVVLAHAPVLSGCASLPGTYNFGPWVEYEAITLSNDGSFQYVWWSDDGGTQCEALGSWIELDGSPRRVQTTVENQVVDAHEDGCIHLANTEVWEVKFGHLVRQGNQRFNKNRRDEG
jgi:hypothetical protein